MRSESQVELCMYGRATTVQEQHFIVVPQGPVLVFWEAFRRRVVEFYFRSNLGRRLDFSQCLTTLGGFQEQRSPPVRLKHFVQDVLVY